MERKTVFKVFMSFNFDKEEAWLNKMADEGWLLEKVGFCVYTFVKGEPGEYTYRLEYTDKSTTKGINEYISFVEDTGAEYVGGLFGWVYFKKKRSLGEFELFSDIDSRLKHLDRIGMMFCVIGFCNIIIYSTTSDNLPDDWFPYANLICAAILFIAALIIYVKKYKLKKDRQLHE